ncbi:MAG: SRPBCC family protein [Fimbriimonadaceae bacterium]|nr:SRPBCC family protein [Fimbriimonadaceae bacterium]
MNTPLQHTPDPSLDLLLERTIDVPVELVWKAWTTPDLLMKWFTPVPWKTIACEMDLRPGGVFATTMQSPEGDEFPGKGCFLEVVENRKLVWTSALLPGYRPQPPQAAGEEQGGFLFTAVICMEPTESGTKYSALAIHADEEAKKQHEAMGFESGWGTALEQMVAMIKSNL